MAETSEKLLMDGARCILLMPDWYWENWYDWALTHTRHWWYFDADYWAFDNEFGKPAGPLRWGLWALDFHHDHVAEHLPERNRDGKMRKDTVSKRRRAQRKFAKKRRDQQ